MILELLFRGQYLVKPKPAIGLAGFGMMSIHFPVYGIETEMCFVGSAMCVFDFSNDPNNYDRDE
jgi:hypothetical protein